jgi:hypothetical protein
MTPPSGLTADFSQSETDIFIVGRTKSSGNSTHFVEAHVGLPFPIRIRNVVFNQDRLEVVVKIFS